MISGKYAKKIRELRAHKFPDVDFKKQLWHRKRNDGFTTIPRTMPLIVNIIDDLSKGAPAGMTYFELWGRSFDEMFVSLSKSKELAFNAGFTGQRAERTWAEKIRKLDELGFIKIKDGQAGPLSFALILNPYLVIKKMHETKQPGLAADKYSALKERALEIGATDLDDDYLDDDEEDIVATPASAAKKALVKPKPTVKKPLTIKPLKKATKKAAA